MKFKNILGKEGEALACNYLKEKGYKIIDTNYKNTIGEIDIIAKIQSSYVFIEVKTRTPIINITTTCFRIYLSKSFADLYSRIILLISFFTK